MKTRTRLLCLLGIVSIYLSADMTLVRAGEILIIVHPGVPVESLDRDTITSIYSGTKVKWENGDKIGVAMLKKGTTHEAFVQDIVGTTPAKLKNIWKKIVFTGTGSPPKIFKQEEQLVEFVSETEGAIGYIDSSTSHEEVKVISIETKE